MRILHLADKKKLHMVRHKIDLQELGLYHAMSTKETLHQLTPLAKQ